MSRSAVEKIGAKENMRSIFVDAPDDVLNDIQHPALDLKKRLTGKFDYIHLFVQSQADFHRHFPKLKNYLQASGMLWVSWPKAGLQNTDLTIKTIIKIGYDYGLVESKTISINTVWSAIKFTWPKAGITYKNSYGKLEQKP